MTEEAPAFTRPALMTPLRVSLVTLTGDYKGGQRTSQGNTLILPELGQEDIYRLFLLSSDNKRLRL